MVENSRVRVYCFWAVRSNQAFSWSAPSTRSSVPRTITEMGLFSTKRSKTLPSMVTSPRECVEKVSSVTSGEREDHLNRAGDKNPRCVTDIRRGVEMTWEMFHPHKE